MAPNGEAPAMAAAVAPLLATLIGSFGSGERRHRTPSFHELRSCVAGGEQKELELLSPDADGSGGGGGDDARSPEVVDAQCECCGMSEECTPEYIRGVRCRFSGRWVCGLCAEAVTEEAEKNGGKLEEALRAHMGVCKRFNGFGRTHPVLFQAEAMREVLRRRAKLGPRSRSTINPREARSGAKPAGGIARSSSCMPFITNEHNDRVSTMSINKN